MASRPYLTATRLWTKSCVTPNYSMVFQIARLVAVVALLVVAAAMAIPKGRLPLALRGVYKLLRRDIGAPVVTSEDSVSAKRRITAFLIVILAIIIAIL